MTRRREFLLARAEHYTRKVKALTCHLWRQRRMTTIQKQRLNNKIKLYRRFAERDLAAVVRIDQLRVHR